MGFSFVNSTPVEKDGQKESFSNGFHFSNRRVRVDWRKLASIDLQRISRELDFEALQNNIFHITFCDINTELDHDIDENFVKLFRLAQMIIEYLLYSQEQLAKSVASFEDKLKYTMEKVDKSKFEHDETSSRKKRNKAQMVYVAKEVHKCKFCFKSFLNDDYLQMHVQRRHGASVENARHENPVHFKEPVIQPAIKEPEINEINLVMKEIKELKEGLEKKNSKITEERLNLTELIKLDLRDIANREAEMRKEMDVWKLEQVDANKKELDGLCNVMMKELHGVQERLQQLNVQSSEPKSNVGLLIDEDEINTELLKRQQDAWEKVQMQLQQQFQQIEKQMQLSLEAQEERIGHKFSHLMHKNYQKLDNIYDTFQRTPVPDVKVPPTVSTSTSTFMPEMKDKGVSVMDGSLRNRKEKISEIYEQKKTSQMDGKLTTDNDIRSAIDLGIKEKSMNKKRKARKKAPVQHINNILKNTIDKELISGLREEVVDLLRERLSDLGVHQNEKGLTDEDLSSKLELQKRDLYFLSKKFPGFSTFRQQIQTKMDKMLSTRRTPPQPEIFHLPKAPVKFEKKMKLDNTYPSGGPIPAPRKFTTHSSGGRTMDFTSSENVFKEVEFMRSTNNGEATKHSEPATNFLPVSGKPPLAVTSHLNNSKDNIATTPAPQKPSRANLMVPASESTDEESQSDLEDILNRIPTSPTKIIGAGNAKDDNSSNTAGTSIWTSTASQITGGNKAKVGNSAASATSWDSSDDDISEIKMP